MPAQAQGEDGEWSIKPRGRLQIDAGGIEAGDAVEATIPGELDFDVMARRAYLGVDVSMPGNLKLRVEGDNSGVIEGGEFSWTDVYLAWEATEHLTLTLGNQKPAWGLEEQTSDLFPSFLERAALNTAFGNERRVGLSVQYAAGDALFQGGAFLDDLDAILDGEGQGHSYFGRAVYAPRVGSGRLHLGARINHRDLGDAGAGIRYSTRPFLRTVDTRFVNTGTMAGVTGETGYGLEFAYISGPFHATGEAHWQHVGRTGALPEPTFSGFYAEFGYFLTPGDTRGYKAGQFDRVKPKRPLGKGGFGALQVNLRYDRLDLVDAGIVGGRQDTYAAGLIWTPTDRTRFMLDYARLQFDSAAISAGGDRSYGADAFGMRAQFDF